MGQTFIGQLSTLAMDNVNNQPPHEVNKAQEEQTKEDDVDISATSKSKTQQLEEMMGQQALGPMAQGNQNINQIS